MNIFDAIRLVDVIEKLQLLQSSCGDLVVFGRPNVSEAMYQHVVETIKLAIAWCDGAGFGDVSKKATLGLFRIEQKTEEQKTDASAIDIELRHISENIIFELGHYRFLQVSKGLIGHLDNPNLLGKTVTAAFPSAANDIREAGNCLAADCNTAAVFHLMRVVEWGLRALALDLGFSRVCTDLKRKKYTSIPYSQWEKILGQLQAHVNMKIASIAPGKKKQKLQEFYFPALQDIQAIKDAWRNHVMHARREYAAPDAAAVLSHVTRLMVTLATRLREG
jgi:hypothetical protein